MAFWPMTLRASSIAPPRPKWILRGGGECLRAGAEAEKGDEQCEDSVQPEISTRVCDGGVHGRRLHGSELAGRGSGYTCVPNIANEFAIAEPGRRASDCGCRAGSGPADARGARLFAPCS